VTDIYIDGEFVAREKAAISVLDRAVQLGDGLFETVRGHFGRPAFLDKHLLRMRRSAMFIKIPFRHDEREISEAVVELCRRNEVPEARIRLTLTRGIHPGGFELEGGIPSLIATAEPYEPHPPEKYGEGYKLVVSRITHFSRGALSGHKTLNYLEFLLARDEAAAAGADEAILLNELGNVAECSSANIFCLQGGVLVTPDFDSGILPGVVRDIVIGLAGREGIPVSEEHMPLEKLIRAQEVFITSSLRGVMPVCQVGERVFGKDRPITDRLSALYSAELDAACRD
jgi:branched-chain amino acid aminotransferase